MDMNPAEQFNIALVLFSAIVDDILSTIGITNINCPSRLTLTACGQAFKHIERGFRDAFNKNKLKSLKVAQVKDEMDVDEDVGCDVVW